MTKWKLSLARLIQNSINSKFNFEFNIQNSINAIKDKKHMITLISKGKTLNKIQDLFTIKLLNKLGVEGNILYLIKN